MTADAATAAADAPCGDQQRHPAPTGPLRPLYSSESASSSPTASDGADNTFGPAVPAAAAAATAAANSAVDKSLSHHPRSLSPDADAAPRRDQEERVGLPLVPTGPTGDAEGSSDPLDDISSSENDGGDVNAEEAEEEHVLTGKILDAPAGKRVWCDGMTPDSRQCWWDELLALSTLAIFTCWIHILAGLMIWALFNKWVALVVVALWSTVLLPAEPLCWERFLGNPVFKSWRRYFRFSVAYDTAIDLSKTYIYSEVPHSVFPLSQLIATSLGADAWQGHKVYSIAADSVLRIPLWRHIFTWVGARPATAKMFKYLLREKGSVGLVPGGIAEMFMSEAPAYDVVKLADRKGFIRVAIETGTPVVPIHHFGAWDLCRWAAPKSWAALSRRLRTSLGFVVGRYGLPLPHRVPLFMAVGEPVPVPHMSPSDPGFKEAVDAVHAQVMEAHRSLFYRYRPLYPGYENREIKIV